MKKIIFGICTVLAIAGASCSKDKSSEEGSNVPKELSDSISSYAGSTLGAYMLSDFNNYTRNSDVVLSKQDIIKGIQLAFANSDNESVVTGMQIGSQFLYQFKQYKAQGIDIDLDKVLKNFRKVFLADTLDMEALARDNGKMNDLMSEVEKIADGQKAAAAESEAEQNVAEGRAFVENLKSNDSDIITSASGLSYKIINPGSEPRVEDNSIIDVLYTGSLIDGTIFDQNIESPVAFSPSQVVPGFAEGLKLLGKGGKAILYIPGELAYGMQGAPQVGIGPNAMLVFEVEIADVHNPE